MPSTQVGFIGIGIAAGTAAMVVKNIVSDYTLLEEDFAGGVYIRVDKATSVVVTIPDGLVAEQPCHITQTGLGTVSVANAGPVTVQSTDGWRKCRTRYSNLTLIPTSSNIYDLIGDLAE